MKEADWCCGGAGDYSFKYPQVSLTILERKLANIAETGAEIVATGCPSCQAQLRLGVKRADLKVRVMHPVQLLAEAYLIH